MAQIILSTATLAAVYVFRKPSWSRLRFWGVATGTSFGSLALGNALTLKSHFDFVRSLNNPAGFAEAMERIQKQSGLQQPHGPVIQRKYNIEEGLHGNVEQHQGPCDLPHQPFFVKLCFLYRSRVYGARAPTTANGARTTRSLFEQMGPNSSFKYCCFPFINMGCTPAKATEAPGPETPE